MNTSALIVLGILGITVGVLARFSFQKSEEGAKKHRPRRRKLVVVTVVVLFFTFLLLAILFSSSLPSSRTIIPNTKQTPSLYPASEQQASYPETLVLIKGRQGGEFKQFQMSAPPYVLMTNASGNTTMISGPLHYNSNYGTQIDLQPPNIIVNEGPQQRVITYDADKPLNVTLYGSQSIHLSNFSQIRIVPPLLSPSTKNVSQPQPSGVKPQSPDANWTNSSIFVYAGVFSSFLGIGYFVRDVAASAKKRLV